MGTSKIYTVFLLLLGIAGYALCATCPPSESISPCTCLDDEDEDVDLVLECTEEDMTLEALKKALGSVNNELTLSIFIEMNIGTLPSNIFEGLKVEKLEFSHCVLDRLAEEGSRALSGLEDTLKELNIVASFNEENVPTKLDVSHLRRLSHLDLSYNAISELGDEWFEHGPTSLTHIIFSNNGIEKIGARAFSNLRNLQELWLDGNRFGPISRSLLPNPANRLEELELDNNAFTSIPENMFSGMPALKTISLRMNGISRIPQRTWGPVWQQLEMIDFRGNLLDCDSHMDWISNSKTLAAVSGTCETPREKKGRDIKHLMLQMY